MTTSTSDLIINHHLDTQGLICPEPVMMLHRTIRKADGGDIIEILATDPATTRDIPNFCRHLGHELLHHELLNKETLTDNTNLSLVADGLDNGDDCDSNDVKTASDGSTYRYLVKKKSA